MSETDVAFRGWPAEALDFYEGLEVDNSKAYWTAHKELYEKAVLAPMTALLAQLVPEFGESIGRLRCAIGLVTWSAERSTG